MTTPVTEYPATVDAVAGWLKLPTDGGAAVIAERAAIASAVLAVNAFVATFHDVETRTLPQHVVQGAVMLAGRITRRRNSPAGVESFGEMGATYVARYDPDVNMLLGLAGYRPIVVG